MAFSIRSNGTAVSSANNVANPTTLAVPYPATIAASDVLLILTTCRSSTPTVATPTGFTRLVDLTDTAGRIVLFGKVADGTETGTINVVWSGLTTGTGGTPCSARMTSAVGIGLTPEVIGTMHSTTSATVGDGGASITTLHDSMVFSLFTRQDDAGTWTPPSGFSTINTHNTTSGADMAQGWSWQDLVTPGATGAVTWAIASGISFPSSGVLVAFVAPVTTVTSSGVSLGSTFTPAVDGAYEALEVAGHGTSLVTTFTIAVDGAIPVFSTVSSGVSLVTTFTPAVDGAYEAREVAGHGIALVTTFTPAVDGSYVALEVAGHGTALVTTFTPAVDGSAEVASHGVSLASTFTIAVDGAYAALEVAGHGIALVTTFTPAVDGAYEALEIVSSGIPARFTATDDFNRANGSIGLAWTRSSDSSTGFPAVVSNRVWGDSGQETGAAQAFGTYVADQAAQVTDIDVSPNGSWVGVSVRDQNAGQDRYVAIYFNNSGTYEVRLYRRTSGSYNQIGSTYTIPSIAPTDVLKIDAVGSTITAYLNGVSRVSVTDTTHVSGGAPGIVFFRDGSADDWQGWSLAPATVFTPAVDGAYEAAEVASSGVSLATTFTIAADGAVDVAPTIDSSGLHVTTTFTVAADGFAAPGTKDGAAALQTTFSVSVDGSALGTVTSSGVTVAFVVSTTVDGTMEISNDVYGSATLQTSFVFTVDGINEPVAGARRMNQILEDWAPVLKTAYYKAPTRPRQGAQKGRRRRAR